MYKYGVNLVFNGHVRPCMCAWHGLLSSHCFASSALFLLNCRS